MNYAGKFPSSGSDSFSNAHVDLGSLSSHGDTSSFVVPDAHLLFSGNYQRSGGDLVISDQLQRLVIPNYFRGEHRPLLVSPDGAPLDSSIVDALTGHTQYAQAGGNVAAKVVGHVAKMTGSCSIVRNGVTIDVQNGDVVYQSDVVQTGSRSTLGLVLNDGTTFNLSANARLMLNDLTYDASSTSNSSFITLVEGAANFIAGQVAKTGDMKVATPVAVIGIRGTAVKLDISAADGKVDISVIDQQDGQVHSVQVFKCVPTGVRDPQTGATCSAGDSIGTISSNGPSLSLTPAANFDVTVQQSNKTPAQIAQEFSAFQAAVDTYNVQKQIDPSLPQHTENGGTNNANPQQTRTASVGSTPADPPPTDPIHAANIGLGIQNATGGAVTPTVVALTVSPSSTGGTTPTQQQQVQSDPVVVPQVVPAGSVPSPVTSPTVTKISTGSGDHFGPVMSADGQFVTYDPDGAIFLFDRKTGITIMIASPSGGFTFSAPTISSDGRFIVYQRSDGVIFTYNNDSSDAAHYKQTTQIAAGSSPAVSGDGSKILVENGGNIVVYDQQGHVLTKITPADAGIAGALWKPSLSANGHVIAFWGSDSADPHGSGQLFSYNQSTGSINLIANTASEVGSSGASISADGHFLVYQSNASGGHSEIYLYDLTTRQVVFHTADASGGSYNPVVSPDGHFIIFASDARLTANDINSVADTYVVDVTDPSSPHFKLVSALADGTQGDAGSNLGAAISTGGMYIAFGSSASNFFSVDGPGGNIFVVDPTSGRSAIINETASSPSILTASGTIVLSGDHTGTTIGVSGDPATFSASFDNDGNIQWTFSEAKSDFAALAYGQDAVQQFNITLTHGADHTTIPVTIAVHNAIQTVTTESLAFDTGASAIDHITSNGTLGGTGLANTAVHFTIDGSAIGATATADAQGAWSFTPTGLADGAHTIVASQTDVFGNAHTASLSFTLDTTAPAAATPDLAVGSDTGSSNSDNVTSAIAPSFTLALGPTVVAGDTVQLLLGGSPLAHPVTRTVTVAEVIAGSVSLVVTAGDLGADGVKQISAQFSDLAGNSSTTGALSVTLDTAAPTEALAITAIASDSGSSSSDFITNDTTLTVSGTNGALAAGEKIQVSSDGGATWTDVVQNTSTSWSLTDGTSHPSSFTYQARIVDIVDTAGNVGSTASQVVTIDTAAPSGATPDLTTASDSGTSSSDNVTSITAPSFTVAFAPTVVAGDTVELLLGGSPLAHPVTHTITAAEVTAGSVSLAVTAGDLGADGVKQISAQFSDLAGNSSTTGALSVTLNTAAPAETLAITAIASDTGSSSSDFITSDTTLTVSGTNGALSAGEKIQLSSDGGTTWTDVIQKTSTSWSLADGISIRRALPIRRGSSTPPAISALPPARPSPSTRPHLPRRWRSRRLPVTPAAHPPTSSPATPR